jgi:hypothetical protein
MRRDIFRQRIPREIWESDMIDCTMEAKLVTWPSSSDPWWSVIHDRRIVSTNWLLLSPEFDGNYRPRGSRSRLT